jgi:hypothetical protein
MIVDTNPKFDNELMRLVMLFLKSKSLPALRDLMDNKQDDKPAFVLECAHEVHDGLEAWLKKGKNRNYKQEFEDLFQEMDNACSFVEEKINTAYNNLIIRTKVKYDKDKKAKTVKREEMLASLEPGTPPPLPVRRTPPPLPVRRRPRRQVRRSASAS